MIRESWNTSRSPRRQRNFKQRFFWDTCSSYTPEVQSYQMAFMQSPSVNKNDTRLQFKIGCFLDCLCLAWKEQTNGSLYCASFISNRPYSFPSVVCGNLNFTSANNTITIHFWNFSLWSNFKLFVSLVQRTTDSAVFKPKYSHFVLVGPPLHCTGNRAFQKQKPENSNQRQQPRNWRLLQFFTCHLCNV